MPVSMNKSFFGLTVKLALKVRMIPLYVFLASLTSCYYDNEETLYPVSVCDTVSPAFSTVITPIIASNCQGCHSGSAPSAGLSLTTYAQIQSAVQSKNLMDHVMQTNGYSLMPPSGMLSNCKIDQLNTWISGGMPNN